MNSPLREHLAVSLLAVAIASVAFAAASNHQWLYRVGGWFHLTKRAGDHQPWDEMFANRGPGWLRIRFKNNLVLIGCWEWASLGDAPLQLFVGKAIWYEGEADNEGRAVDGAGVLLPNMDEVLGIDFVEGTRSDTMTDTKEGGKKGGKGAERPEPKPVRDGFREDGKPLPDALYKGGKPDGDRPPKK